MEWFPFHVSDLSSAKVSAATSHAFGAWVRVLGNCYRLENGGCYKQCSEHSDRQWMSMAGVDREEVASIVQAGLAAWVDGDLVVDGYDKEQETKATSRSKKGSKAAEIRWGNARSIACGNTEERRGEERKGEEKKEDPPLPPGGGKRVRRVSTASEAFEKFYATYPRHTARAAAEKAWPGDDHLPAILAALEWQCPDFRSRPYDKIPHPATWLNGKRWLDEKPTQLALGAQPQRQPRDIRVGHVRAEDCTHGQLGEVKDF